VADTATTVKYVIVDGTGEVIVIGTDGANEAVGLEDVDPSLVAGCHHVHLTGQRPPTAAALARLADEAEATVSFDPGRRLCDPEYSKTLRMADLVYLNAREAEAVTEFDPAARQHCVVVRKRGRSGRRFAGTMKSCATTTSMSNQWRRRAASAAFAAGFIAARFDDADKHDALAFANACGALATAGQGGWAVPNRDEVEALLEDGR
jgi:ribokinase